MSMEHLRSLGADRVEAVAVVGAAVVVRVDGTLVVGALELPSLWGSSPKTPKPQNPKTPTVLAIVWDFKF